MKWIGQNLVLITFLFKIKIQFSEHLEINHWLNNGILPNWYSSIVKNKRNIHFISYAKLYSNRDYWYQIKKLVNIEKPYDFEFKESKKIFHNLDKVLKESYVFIFRFKRYRSYIKKISGLSGSISFALSKSSIAPLISSICLRAIPLR